MKGFFENVKRQVKSVQAPVSVSHSGKRKKQQQEYPVLTAEEREQNSELAAGVDQLGVILGVVKSLTLDVEKFMNVVQDLCIHHIKMADGFRVIFAKSSDKLRQEESLSYTGACANLANRDRGDCERKLQTEVLAKLNHKTDEIRALNQHVFKWQSDHALFVTTLQRARKKHFRSGSTSTDLDPNDVSEIRLAEGALESSSRSLVLEIEELHRSRFEWIRDIVNSFKTIQAEFYCAAGSTLGGGMAAMTMTALKMGNISSKGIEVLHTLPTSSTKQNSVGSVVPSSSSLPSTAISTAKPMAVMMPAERAKVRNDVLVDVQWLMLAMSSKEIWDRLNDDTSVNKIHKHTFTKDHLNSTPQHCMHYPPSLAVLLNAMSAKSFHLNPAHDAAPFVAVREAMFGYLGMGFSGIKRDVKHDVSTNGFTQWLKKSHKHDGPVDDPVMVAFAGIDVDIERTGSRKQNGRTKRGGKLKGYTAKYKGDDSQDALASLVASALGEESKSRAATEEDLQVQLGEEEQEEEQKAAAAKPTKTEKKHEAQVRNVLRAFVIADNDATNGGGLCYSQGLNFLASALLHRCEKCTNIDWTWGVDKQDACFGMFWWIVHGPFNLGGVYADGFSGLQQCFVKLDKLLLIHFPRIIDHFQECNVTCSMFATAWFTTLFTNCDTLPSTYAEHVLDIFLVDGWKFVYQVALAILGAVRPMILGSDFEAILRIMQDPEPIVLAAYKDPQALVHAADQFEV